MRIFINAKKNSQQPAPKLTVIHLPLRPEPEQRVNAQIVVKESITVAAQKDRELLMQIAQQ
jgi:hypothetical protein